MATDQDSIKCNVEGDEIVIRIPIDVAVHAFDNKDRDYEAYGVITVAHKSDFADELCLRIIEGHDLMTGVPHWGAMLDKIGEEMIEDGAECLEFEEPADHDD